METDCLDGYVSLGVVFSITGDKPLIVIFVVYQVNMLKKWIMMQNQLFYMTHK